MILDKEGKELKGSISKQVYKYVKTHTGVMLAMIPFLGVLCSAIINFGIYMYGKGRAIYFDIPEQYILVNYKVTIYQVLIRGGIGLIYLGMIMLTFKLWSQRKVWVEKIGITFIFPELFFFVLLSFSLDNPYKIFIISKIEIVIVYMVALIMHCICTFTIGRFMVNSLLDESGKRTVVKRNEYYLKIKDTVTAISIFFFIMFVIYSLFFFYMGLDKAKNEKIFQIVEMEGSTYAIVMMDGEQAILKRCEIQDDEKKLQIYISENVKVNCMDLLMKKYGFLNVTIDR